MRSGSNLALLAWNLAHAASIHDKMRPSEEDWAAAVVRVFALRSAHFQLMPHMLVLLIRVMSTS